MAQQISQGQTTLIRERVLGTGEVTINLNLTIKLDGNGLTIDTEARQLMPKPNKVEKQVEIKEDDDLYIDLGPSEVIEFGRKA